MAYALTATVQLTTSAGTVDITGDVLAKDGIVCTRGRTQAGPEYVVAEPGTAVFYLNNSATNSGGVAGYYSPYHASCRTGFGLRNLVTIKLACPTYPSGTTIWKGRITDLSIETGRYRGQRVRVTAVDAVANLAEAIVKDISLQLDKRQDQLIASIFSATDDPDYTVHYTLSNATGTSTFDVSMDIAHGSTDTTILEEVTRIVSSERGRMYLKRDSVLTFESRTSWAGASVVHTLSDDMVDLSLRTSSDDLVQKINLDVYPAKTDASAVVLYSLGTSSVLVQPGEVNTSLFGPFRNPNATSETIGGTTFETVTATTDYTMNAAADGGGSNLTANFTVSASTTAKGVAWTITNTGSTAGYITKLQLRGLGIYRSKTSLTRTVGTASYGSRSITLSMPYQSDLNIAASVLADTAAALSRPGQPAASSVRFLASDTNSLADAAVIRDQGDRIAITETQSGLNAREYIICGQKYEIHAGGIVWCTWFLEAVSMSSWVTPVFSAGTFTAGDSMTWTVEAADVTTFRYLLNDDTLVLSFDINSTTIGGTPSTELRITLPEGLSVATTTGTGCAVKDGGSWVDGLVEGIAGDTFIRIARADLGTFSTVTNNASVRGQIFLEVDTGSRWQTAYASAGSYTANGSMTWTVGGGDIVTNRYAYDSINKTFAWMFYVFDTTVGGTPNTELRIANPLGLTSARTVGIPCWINDNGTSVLGLAIAPVGQTYLQISRNDSANFTGATNNTDVLGQIVYSVS